MTPGQATPAWSWRRFEQLSGEQMYDLLALRTAVFVVEQDCAFLDADDADRTAWHLLGTTIDDNGRPFLAAYLRCLDPGVRYPEPSIGRVVVDARRRGSGLGRVLMAEGIARTERAWPGHDIVLNAQHRLEAFYRSLGFATEGQPYLEDDIEHVAMRRAGRSRHNETRRTA